MNEALAKMKELGFEGNWVRELLNTVKCDISKAVEILNPTNPTEPQLD
jgi:transcriptional regulator with GAF, ATPase, and Fis domain